MKEVLNLLTVNDMANAPLYAQLLISFLCYRLLAPLVDFINPIRWIPKGLELINQALLKQPNMVGTACNSGVTKTFLTTKKERA